MALPSWADWFLAGVAAFCAALGAFGVAFMEALTPWRAWLVGAGFVFLLASIVFFGLSLSLSSWNLRLREKKALKKKKRQREAEMRQREKIKEELYGQWLAPCHAWEKFHDEAGGLLHTVDLFRYESTPENWQEIMIQKSQAAFLRVGALDDRHRLAAFELIRPFAKAAADALPWDYQTALYRLREWLSNTDRWYATLRQTAGIEKIGKPTLPSPP